MIKSNKDFIPQIAEEFQRDAKEVASVIEFYFKDAKTKAEGMVDTDIYLYGFGTLSAKRKKIHDLISYYTVKKNRALAAARTTQEYKDGIAEECDQKINRLNILAQKYKERDERRKNMKLEQKAITGSIQESNSDMEWIEEQPDKE